jgi:hypothetical protein
MLLPPSWQRCRPGAISFASLLVVGETGVAVGVCATMVPVPARGLLASFRLPLPSSSTALGRMRRRDITVGQWTATFGSRLTAMVLALVFASVNFGEAKAGTIIVGASSNIYGAGLSTAPGPGGNGGGSVPPLIDVTGVSFLNFQVSGTVSYNGGGNYYGADGGPIPTQMDSYGSISGITNNSANFFLVGVFLNDQAPSGPAPAILDFTNNEAFPSLAPSLNQMFFIGDGLTGTGSGSAQSFYVPTGATRLFLGFADGFDFTGLPGTYDDDIGSLTVNFSLTPVPEPPSAILLVIAFSASAFTHWVVIRQRSACREIALPKLAK